jgi:glycosyltransferase involved in cell wall biosynthesis
MSESPTQRSACIVGSANGVGLDQDAALLRSLLDECSLTSTWRQPRLLDIRPRLPLGRPPRSDLLVYLERVFPAWHRTAAKSVLIPNQERYPRRHLRRLRLPDAILCKSHHATEIFSRHHPNVRFLGFTSPDCRVEGIAPDYARCFHLAGRSTLKGTDEVLKAWHAHPDWPVLTLVVHPQNAPRKVPANVELISRHLGEKELRQLQNRCGIHLCPSRSEGWGHYIEEAMSCQAITDTTDAPPMNELVDPRRGVLVPYNRSESRHLGTNFRVDPGRLDNAISRILDTPHDELAGMGRAARRWFEDNDDAFRKRFHALVRELISPS